MIKGMLILLAVLLVAASPFIILSIKFRNPFKLYFVFGKKGAGKTTMLTKLAYEYNRRGVPVYCNTEIPGTYLIDAQDIGFVQFPAGSVIMIDEVSLIWDNRNFKSFKPEVAKFFRLQRHHQLTVWLFSQTFDVDKKIRDLTDKMFMLRNFCGWLSYCKEIRRQLVVVEPTDTSEARIADTLKIPPWYTAIFGTRKFIFVPKWSKYFDSHLIEDPLPEKEYEFQPYKKGTEPRVKGRLKKRILFRASVLLAGLVMKRELKKIQRAAKEQKSDSLPS